jgi:hypothetical protein
MTNALLADYTGSGDLFQDALVDQLQDACEVRLLFPFNSLHSFFSALPQHPADTFDTQDLNCSYTSKIYSPNAVRRLLSLFSFTFSD